MPEVKLPYLHPKQSEIVHHPARFKVLCCGRRWGKTRLAVVIALAVAVMGGAVLWIAPSYAQAEVGWRMLASLSKQITWANIKQGERRIEFGLGWIQVRSADSEGGLRGEGLDLLIADEVAHIRNFTDIWEQELRPALSDRKGKAVFVSTPKGHNHFYDLYSMAQNDPEWASWQLPSNTNPFLDPAEIEAARKMLPALVFRQEYGAEFVQLAGAMFKREYFEIVEKVPELTAQARHWDLAASVKTAADYSAGVKVGMDADGNAYILDCVRDKWEWPALIRIIRDTAKMDTGSIAQSVETAGTQKGMLDLLLAEPSLAGLPIRGITPVVDKIARANSWLARAEQGKVKVLRANWNAAWLDEICAFPEAAHDDMVDGTSGAFTALGDSGPLLAWEW